MIQMTTMKREGRILTNAELNEAIGELAQVLAQYAKEGTAQGLCEQCRHPHHDGICECENYDSANIKMAKLLGYRLESYKDVRRDRMADGDPHAN